MQGDQTVIVRPGRALTGARGAKAGIEKRDRHDRRHQGQGVVIRREQRPGEATASSAARARCRRAGSTGFRRSPRNFRSARDAVVQTDVTDREQVKALVDRAVQIARPHRRDRQQRRPHAAFAPRAAPVDDWDRMIDVNLKGVLYGIAAALPHMKAQKSGHIINVSSVAGHKVRPGSAVYAATKHAVRVLSEGLRQEVKPYNIRTTIISPGAVATELPDSITVPGSPRRSQVLRDCDPRRLLRPDGRVRDEPARGRRHQRESCSGQPLRSTDKPNARLRRLTALSHSRRPSFRSHPS